MSDQMSTTDMTEYLPHPTNPDLRAAITPADADDFDHPLADGESPVTLWCHHPRYDLGTPGMASLRGTAHDLADDGQGDVPGWLARTQGVRLVMPLYLYDHSGLSMSVGAASALHEPLTGPARWDTSIVGFAYITGAEREAWWPGGVDVAGEEAAIRAQVTEYDHYLAGRLYVAREQEARGVVTDRTITHADGIVTREHTVTTEWHDTADGYHARMIGWDDEVRDQIADQFGWAQPATTH